MKHPPRNIAIDWVNTLWSTDLPSNAKLVACNLRRYMNSKNDMAWPSVGRVAGECSLSESSARRALQLLCSEGWLVHSGISNVETKLYQASFPEGVSQVQGVSHRPLGGVTGTPELNNRIKQDIIYKNFKPPTPNEVQEYSSTIDAERFCDFYESKGWLIGKNKMKCWKAAIRNWERNNEKRNNQPKAGGNTGQPERKLTPAQRTAAKRKSIGERNASNLGAVAADERDVWTPVGLTTR